MAVLCKCDETRIQGGIPMGIIERGMMPCIANGTAVHDPNDSCHTTRTPMGMAAAGHDMSTMGG